MRDKYASRYKRRLTAPFKATPSVLLPNAVIQALNSHDTASMDDMVIEIICAWYASHMVKTPITPDSESVFRVLLYLARFKALGLDKTRLLCSHSECQLSYAEMAGALEALIRLELVEPHGDRLRAVKGYARKYYKKVIP